MNENESDAQASSSFFSRRRINFDHLHSAAIIIRCERAQMREMHGKLLFFANWDGALLGVGALRRLHTLRIGTGARGTDKHDRSSNKLELSTNSGSPIAPLWTAKDLLARIHKPSWECLGINWCSRPPGKPLIYSIDNIIYLSYREIMG